MNSREHAEEAEVRENRDYRKVGPGVITLSGNQDIDEVVSDTVLTIVDGQLNIGIMRDSVSIKTQRDVSGLPLNIKVKQILGTGNIDAEGSVCIDKPFNQRVIINAENDILAESIGNASELTARTGGIKVKLVGDCCQLNAAGDIQAYNVSSSSQLSSSAGKIDLNCLGNNSTVIADSSVNVKGSIGVTCAVISNSQNICVGGAIGAHTALQAQQSIVCRDVGVNAAIASQTDDIKVMGKVEDGAALNAYKKITVGCGVGVQAVLVSVSDSIDVRGKIESQSVFSAACGIDVTSELEQGVRMTVTNGAININGNVGSESELQAVGLIKVKGIVQNKASLLCMDGKIVIEGRVSESATLTADQVIINEVPRTHSLETSNTHAIPSGVKRISKPRMHATFWSQKNHKSGGSDVKAPQPDSPRP